MPFPRPGSEGRSLHLVSSMRTCLNCGALFQAPQAQGQGQAQGVYPLLPSPDNQGYGYGQGDEGEGEQAYLCSKNCLVTYALAMGSTSTLLVA